MEEEVESGGSGVGEEGGGEKGGKVSLHMLRNKYICHQMYAVKFCGEHVLQREPSPPLRVVGVRVQNFKTGDKLSYPGPLMLSMQRLETREE